MIYFDFFDYLVAYNAYFNLNPYLQGNFWFSFHFLVFSFGNPRWPGLLLVLPNTYTLFLHFKVHFVNILVPCTPKRPVFCQHLITGTSMSHVLFLTVFSFVLCAGVFVYKLAAIAQVKTQRLVCSKCVYLIGCSCLSLISKFSSVFFSSFRGPEVFGFGVNLSPWEFVENLIGKVCGN